MSIPAFLRPAIRYSQLSLPVYSTNRSSFVCKRWSSIKRYTKEHEWVAFDPKTSIGTIGITNYAQNSLGDVVFVELAEVSAVVSTGQHIGAIESVKAASDVYAPVSGTITEVNTLLSDQAGLLNKSPEGEGWFAKIKLSAPQELDNLLTEESYKAHTEGEH